jgi:Zn-dependent protease
VSTAGLLGVRERGRSRPWREDSRYPCVRSQARRCQAIGATRRACYKARRERDSAGRVRPLRVHADPAGAAAIPTESLSILTLLIGSDGRILHGALVIGMLILSLGIHEAAHAWAAWRCGDSTAKDLGRMTLDPIVHIDLVWTILLPAFLYFSNTGFIFGGAKPVPVDYHRLRKPARDMMLVALAGPLSNLLLAVLFLSIYKAMIYGGGMSPNELAPSVIMSSAFFNIVLAVFNMIPVPPLDGSRVVAYLLRGQARESYVMFERFGLVVIIVLMVSGLLQRVLIPAVFSALGFIDSVTGGVWNL